GLTNPFTGKQMAPEAGHVADELEMTRADMDRFALRSHQLAVEATDAGRLPEEIVDVTVKGKKGDTTVEIDEGPRRDASLEALSKLRPIPGHDSHTAGNSPGINDGARALVLASDAWPRYGRAVAKATRSSSRSTTRNGRENRWQARPRMAPSPRARRRSNRSSSNCSSARSSNRRRSSGARRCGTTRRSMRRPSATS